MPGRAATDLGDPPVCPGAPSNKWRAPRNSGQRAAQERDDFYSTVRRHTAAHHEAVFSGLLSVEERAAGRGRADGVAAAAGAGRATRVDAFLGTALGAALGPDRALRIERARRRVILTKAVVPTGTRHGAAARNEAGLLATGRPRGAARHGA